MTLLVQVFYKTFVASLQALNEEFQKYRPKLETLEEITDYLLETEKDDPTLTAEVRDKFSAVEEPFERLHSTVLHRQARLQNIVIQGQDFQLSLSEAQDQLNEFERNIAQLPAISATYEVVQQQKEDHEVNNKCLCFFFCLWSSEILFLVEANFLELIVAIHVKRTKERLYEVLYGFVLSLTKFNQLYNCLQTDCFDLSCNRTQYCCLGN